MGLRKRFSGRGKSDNRCEHGQRSVTICPLEQRLLLSATPLAEPLAELAAKSVAPEGPAVVCEAHGLGNYLKSVGPAEKGLRGPSEKSHRWLARNKAGVQTCPTPVLDATVSGPDPVLSIPVDLSASQGETLTVAVSLDLSDLGGADFWAGNIELEYDTDVFDVANADVRVGALLSGWTLTPNVDDSMGLAQISLFNTTSPVGVNGTAFEIDFHVRADAPLGPTTLDLLDTSSLMEGALTLTLEDGLATIVGENTSPTVALEHTVGCLSETTDTSSRIQVADVVVTDDGLGANELSLGGADAAMFELDGTILYLKAGTVLDHETNPVLEVTVAVDDAAVGSTPDDTASLSIAITAGMDDILHILDSMDSYIQNLSDEAFKWPAPQRKHALHNKVAEVKRKIEGCDYVGAMNKLLNDVRAKADGSLGGKANNDWITDPAAQLDLCNMIDDVTTHLAEQIAFLATSKC